MNILNYIKKWSKFEEREKLLKLVTLKINNNHKPEFLSSNIIEKSWGYERILINNDKFCGKILVYDKKENYSSFHKHKLKDEVFVVSCGKFLLKFYNSNNQIEYKVLNKGDIVYFLSNTAHQLRALEDNSQIFEISTHDDPDDIVRIEPSMLKL